MSEELANRETARTADGFIYDTDTGEVVGHDQVPGPDQPWEVNSIASADWVLELRSEIEGEIAGIQAQLEAVTKMLQARKSAAMRKLSWWEFRFAPSLIAFAKSCLTGKSRTAQFSWGRVSFRKTGGNNEIIDMKAAVEWMRNWNPGYIKSKEWVNVSDLLETKKVVDSWDEEEGMSESLPFLVSSEPSENVTISTGIEINREERTTQ
jgi:phage host-nuclease inhibitor protein Gam